MNLIKTVGTPLQQMFAALAIFALLAMPLAQVGAQEVTEPAEPAEVQEPAAPAAPEIPVDTLEQKVVDEVAAPSEPASAELMTVCPSDYDTLCAQPAPVTIVAEKIVCTDEADLPNWGNNIPAKIDGNTAANWLVDHESCKLASGWDFEWGLDKAVSDPGGTKVGTAGGNWHTFGSTNTNGKVSVTLSSSDLGRESKVWLREVLKDNYLSFSDLKKVGNTPIGESVSAEFYCHTDGLNYDNYEWIDDVDAGETFNCVAWNVPEKGSITIEKKTIGDAKDWSFGFTGMGGFTLTDEEPSEIFSGLTVGEYAFDEIVPEGWDLTDVTCNDVRPVSVQTAEVVPAPTPDLVVTLDPGENVKCTFTNTEEPVQNTCLLPVGGEEPFVVGTSQEKTLQTILTENSIAADVEDDQYDYQVWNFASGDTDTVTFEVKLLGGVAGNIQEFGYYNADTDAGFTSLFSVPPQVVGYTQSVTVPASVADSLGFAIRTTKGDASQMWYSEKALNTASEDHVAVYNPANSTYVLAFEDLAFNGGDKDYNDLVVQVKVLRCSEVQTPICQTKENLLSNGSFELNGVTDLSLWQKFSTVTGWAVAKVSDAVATTLELHKGWSGNVAAQGAQYAELDGDESVRVSQKVATIPGATYELRWAFAPRQNTDVTQNKLSVEVDGLEVDTTGPVAGGASSLLVADWTLEKTQFVAKTANTEVAFKDAGASNSYGTFLDDACLIKVKDPVVEPKVCTVTLVSGTDLNTDGSDDNTTVVEKTGALAKLLAPIHTAWTAAITGASWIWGDNPVAAPVDGVAQTFVRKFGWAGLTVTDVKLYVAADNSYVATLNGDAAGLDAGEFNYNLAGQDVYTLANTIVDAGNNILSINVVNKPSSVDPLVNPAGLMYKLVITGTGENCEVPYDDGSDDGDDDPEPTGGSNGSSGSSNSPRCEEKDFDLDDGVLSWKTKNGYDLSIEKNGDEIFTTDDRDEVKAGTLAVSSDSGDTFKLTVNRNSKKDTCTIELGSVLGDSTSRDGGVGGASTMMPAGAPNTGAGGTSPVVVTLPSLVAVLGARASVQKTR